METICLLLETTVHFYSQERSKKLKNAKRYSAKLPDMMNQVRAAPFLALSDLSSNHHRTAVISYN